MIIPVGKQNEQKRQGACKNSTFSSNDLFANVPEELLQKMAISLPSKKQPEIPTPNSEMEKLRQTTNSGTLNNRGIPQNTPDDIGVPGEQNKSIMPSGNPVMARPSGATQQTDIQETNNFWSQLAQALSPFLKQRNLQVMDSPKLVDKENHVFDLVLGPMTDPRTGQPMVLSETDLTTLFADANKMADAAKGRVFGLPYIDNNQMWHIPLQMSGGSSGKKLVSKK